MCPENPNESVETELMSEFRKAIRYKINIQNSMYTYKVAIQKIKFKNSTLPKPLNNQEKNLTKGMQDFYIEKYKAL